MTVAETGTPVTWRLAAAGIAVVAVSIGFAGGLWLPWPGAAALGVVLVAYVVPIVVRSRRPPLEPLEPADLDRLGPLPTIAVVVAARDEAAVVGSIVADIAAQDHRGPDGRPCFRLVVIDDRSEDGTGDAALAAAEAHGIGSVTTVVRRASIDGRPLPDGKGAALTAAQPGSYAGDVTVVLDADARVDPTFLRRAAGYFARGAQAITARRRIIVPAGLPPLAAQLAGAQADEQTSDGEIQRGRWAGGGCSEFRGNGIMVRTDLLASVGGWHAHALCEDLDLSSRIAALGVTVGWALDVVVWEEPVLGVRGLFRQRMRWASGIIRRELELTWPLVRSRRLSPAARLDYVLYSLQTVLPPALLAAIAGSAVAGNWPTTVIPLGAYLLSGMLLAMDSLRWDGFRGTGRLAARAARSLRVVLFSTLWLPVLALAWVRVAFGRGAIRYAKMAHEGAPAGWAPDREGEPRP